MPSVDMHDESIKEPLLLRARDVAQLIQVSLRTLWRMRSAGQLPAPVTLGGGVRWRYEEIKQWITGLPVTSGSKT
jgi:excisionase family DNA binding protein